MLHQSNQWLWSFFYNPGADFSFLYFQYNTEVISILTSTTPDGINSSTQYSIFCQHSQLNFIAQKHTAIYLRFFLENIRLENKRAWGSP